MKDMIARLLSFKRTVAAALIGVVGLCGSASVTQECDTVPAGSGQQELTAYQLRLARRAEQWNKLIPEILTLQFAGGIGMFSAGFGWDYGRSNQWETHLLFGFTPKRNNYPTYWTITLREYYNPWKIHIGELWSISPLSVNLSLNSIIHNDFWMSEPDRYPSGYYGFSSRMRFQLGLGQRFTFNIPEHKRFLSSSVSVYYEVSTCDLYLRQKWMNSSIPFKDIIMLGVGVLYKI